MAEVPQWKAVLGLECGAETGVREGERVICEEKQLLNMWCDRGRRCAAMWVFPYSNVCQLPWWFAGMVITWCSCMQFFQPMQIICKTDKHVSRC